MGYYEYSKSPWLSLLPVDEPNCPCYGKLLRSVSHRRAHLAFLSMECMLSAASIENPGGGGCFADPADGQAPLSLHRNNW